jgi:acyl carrier protein
MPDTTTILHNSQIQLIVDTINEVLAENGHDPALLRPETNILQETNLDSMGLAIVVVRLEEKTGKDPFAQGFISFQTVQELATLYAG